MTAIQSEQVNPVKVLLTHGHLDHVGGTADLARLLGGEVPIGLHPDEIELYRNGTIDLVVASISSDMAYDGDYTNRDGTVVEEGRGQKVIAFKKKRRKGYKRKIGHRQSYTALRIDKISV